MERFHSGERAMHALVGLRERVEMIGQRAIRDHMPDQHRDFFAMLPTVHLGAVDPSGHPWALTRVGRPGFMASPDPQTLEITSRPLAAEPTGLCLRQGDKISVLGLEYATRRRNRLNATIAHVQGDMLRLHVDQSFGNCPKYIQTRTLMDATTAPGPVRVVPALDADLTARVDQADTLFIASRAPDLGQDPTAGVDVNHRGGKPGFITVLSPTEIEFPDYAGNNFFQTLGNIQLDSRVGLQIVDFQTGDLLNLTGQADLLLSGPGDAPEPPLTNRRVRVHLERITHAPAALPLRYGFEDYSPALPNRG